jgi:hypothetical protein
MRTSDSAVLFSSHLSLHDLSVRQIPACRPVMFRYISKIGKSNYKFRYVCLFDGPLAWNNSGPTGRNVIKFEIQDLFKLCQKIDSR